ncbi:MAG: hypothetical protein NVS1B3_13120 [Candidatus Dormibacteraceae bacterium]
MRLEHLCSMDLKYVGGFHLLKPYGNESGLGFGVGEGTASGDRLSGTVQWSNHPRRRGDGVMLPNARGLITTRDGAEVLFDLAGRTVWVDLHGKPAGRQLLLTLFETADERYAWLNNTACIAEGVIDQATLVMHLDIHLCKSDLA